MQKVQKYVSLSLTAPEFGPRKLYANLGCAARQDDDEVYAVIWSGLTARRFRPRAFGRGPCRSNLSAVQLR
jgi:uncharacterized protein (DUF736 family)